MCEPLLLLVIVVIILVPVIIIVMVALTLVPWTSQLPLSMATPNLLTMKWASHMQFDLVPADQLS